MLAHLLKKCVVKVLKQIEDRNWNDVAEEALKDFPSDLILSDVEKWHVIWKVKESMGGSDVDRYNFERFMRREVWI